MSIDGLSLYLKSYYRYYLHFTTASGKVNRDQEKPLFCLCVDLEKAFDCVPHRIIWWSLRNLGVDGWVVSLVHCMYANTRSRVHVGDRFIDFEMKKGGASGISTESLTPHHCA